MGATMAIPMPTMATTTARGLLMPRPPPLLRLLPLPRLTLMSSMPPMPTAMASTILMPTDITPTDTVLDTTATPMPTSDTTARGPLMLRLPPLLRPMLMLTMDTTAMPTTPMPTDMPTVPMDTTATPSATDTDTTDKM